MVLKENIFLVSIEVDPPKIVRFIDLKCISIFHTKSVFILRLSPPIPRT